MKKQFVFIFMIIGVFLLGGVSAFAASENGYNYTVSTSGEATITYCPASKSGSVTIPDTLGGYAVTSIGARAFSDCINITRISIPNSVKSIGDRAFYNCQNVTYIYIPSSVTSIGNSAFTRCNSLDRIAVSNDNTEFSEQFTVKGLYNKNGTKLLRHVGNVLLGKITIPSSVTSIGNCAFEERYDITEITIPNSVTNIGDSAFYHCTELESVTIGNNVIEIGKNAFSSCSELSNISLPNKLKNIGSNAFYNCTKLVNITIPDTVISIGSGAFSTCSGLTDITMGNGITSIASTTFYNCSNLKNITIPNGVKSIEPSAFQDCKNLTSITFPNSINEIGAWAFKNCSKLSDVYYNGTQEEWKSTIIGEENTCLTKATIHYHIHSFSWLYEADNHFKKCECGEIEAETVGVHTFVDCADIICDCGYERTIGHKLTKTEPIPATCILSGNIEYWTCSECHKFFSNSVGTNEIQKNSWVILEKGHLYGDKISEQSAIHTSTELKPSVEEHYLCKECNTYFTSEKVATTLSALTGETPTHSYGSWVTTDSNVHWKECSCGLRSSENSHADSNNDHKCDICSKDLRVDFEISSYDNVTKKVNLFIPVAGTYSIIFADYEGKRLNELDIVTVTVTADKVGEITQISEKGIDIGTDDKIMLWSNMTTLIPICEAYIVE